jgi:LysM repeat protein
MHCIRRVNEEFPDSPKAIIGALSAERGGPLKPHKSHRTGRDVDVYLYRIGNKKRWYEPAGPDDLDRARNWALLRALITEADVEFVLLDRSIQVLLEEYALSIGEDTAWVEDLFHGKDRYQRSLIKHIAGHTAHMHIRFVSAVSRERGRLAYDGLVALGHIEPPSRELLHRVTAGETLIGIARQYGTTVEELRRQNQLVGTPLRIGQLLRIRERVDIRGARDAVIVPPRRLPTNERQEQTPTLADLKKLERELTAPLASGPADSEPRAEPATSPDSVEKSVP